MAKLYLKKILSAFILIVLITAGSVFAEAKQIATVETSASKDEITIGTEIYYRLIVKTKKDIEVTFPTLGNEFGVFAVKDFGTKERTFFGKKRIEKWFLLDTYVTGEYEIPSIMVTFTKPDGIVEEIEAKPVKVTINSLLVDAKRTEDIHDIYGPISPKAKLIKYFYFFAIVLILLLLIILFKYLKSKKVFENIIPVPPAHEIAYESLIKLQNSNYIQDGLIKEYYFELSAIVRRYLEDRFNIRAPEMTTEEFLTELKEKKILSTMQKGFLKDFLVQSDMVKFAKYGPAPDEIELSYNAAKKLVDQTKVEDSKMADNYEL